MGQYQSATNDVNTWYTLKESPCHLVRLDVDVDEDNIDEENVDKDNDDEDNVDEDNLDEDNVDEDNVDEDNVDEDNDDEQPRRVIPVTPGSGHFARGTTL